ncbi:MAG TPA: hypothetical protein VFN09_03500 [Rhodanobacteraceae bacterium]|nr:hypothetical protein [Rhodanobacteraceae bacterium]
MSNIPQWRRDLLRRSVLAFTLLSILALPIAFAGVENPADTPKVQSVELSMKLIERLDAVANAAGDMNDRPALFMRTKANKVPKTLGELSTELKASPIMLSAIESQGFTPREYLVSAMAWANTYFGYHLIKDGDESARTSISASQLKFIETHYDELKALQER